MILSRFWVLGATARADLGESDARAGSFAGRAGVLINPNLALYALGEWRVKDLKLSQNGTAYLGLGAETTVIVAPLSVFVEGSTAVSKFGTEAFDRDDMQIRVGARYRFNGAAW